MQARKKKTVGGYRPGMLTGPESVVEKVLVNQLIRSIKVDGSSGVVPVRSSLGQVSSQLDELVFNQQIESICETRDRMDEKARKRKTDEALLHTLRSELLEEPIIPQE